MVRIGKLTDYGMVLMATIASSPAKLFQTKELAGITSLAPATVSKLLKILTKNQFLQSERGALGGYRLAKSPKTITVVDLIKAFEGPIAITQCNLGHAHCPTEANCSIRAPWQHINQMITKALESITLFDLVPRESIPLMQV